MKLTLNQLYHFEAGTFTKNEGSEEFYKWFHNVYKKQYPKHQAFRMHWIFNVTEVSLEVNASDPQFRIENLIALFEAYIVETNLIVPPPPPIAIKPKLTLVKE